MQEGSTNKKKYKKNKKNKIKHTILGVIFKECETGSGQLLYQFLFVSAAIGSERQQQDMGQHLC